MSTLHSQDSSSPNSEDGYAKIAKHVWDFAQDQGDLADAATDVRRYLEELAKLGSIPIHTIEARAKSLASYQEKSQKKSTDGTPKYSDPAAQIHDCVAARVIVFTTRARNDLADLLGQHARVIERQNPGHLKHNGYDSEHIVISGLQNSDESSRHPALARYLDKYRGLEIQIRSVAGHAWAEYEHDIRYKSGAFKELSDDGRSQIDQWFVEAGGFRRVMDEIFERIEARLITVDQSEATSAELEILLGDSEEAFADESDPRKLDQFTLSDLIASRFPDQELGDSAALHQLLEHLLTLDVSTVGGLEVALAEVEEGQVARLMDYPSETSGTRRLDDELLATFTERYVETADGEDRKQFLRLRLRRVRGKFTIYSMNGGAGAGRLLTATRAVRELAKYVANSEGLQAASVGAAVSSEKGALLPSSKARLVRTEPGPVYVATNFTRAWAEEVMSELVERVPGSGLKVFRAGDVLFEAPPRPESARETWPG